MSWHNGEYCPKQKRADERKGRILDAALALFSARGYHGATAKAIAAEAGVATGSFYRYFRDKKAAFMAVCHRMEEQLGGRIFEFGRQMRDEGLTEREILAAVVRHAVTAHGRNGAFHREVLAMQMSDPDVAAWTRKREARVLAALAAFLRPMADAYHIRDLEAATELVYYTIEEVAHRAVLFDNPVGQERLVEALQEMLVRYLFD
jgi:AcrR family transcriptional regulator